MRQVTVALPAQAILDECPRWNALDGLLYWVDIAQNRLHRFDLASGTDEFRRFDAPVGCFAFARDGGFILGMKDGLARLTAWESAPEPFGDQVLAGLPDLRLNDGRTDSRGRFWAGSVNMAKSASNAALYRFDAAGRATLIQNGMMTCNGAAFSGDSLRFYHADTPPRIPCAPIVPTRTTAPCMTSISCTDSPTGKAGRTADRSTRRDFTGARCSTGGGSCASRHRGRL